jgi:type I restriction enzyme S subunit
VKNEWETKTLEEVCKFTSGLWKGENAPYINVGVIRNTNFSTDGKLDDSDIAYIDVESKQLESRKLEFGDIILEKSGGGPKQPVGRVVLFDKKEGVFSFSNFTSSIRIKDKSTIDNRYLHWFLHWLYLSGVTAKIQSNSTGIRNLDNTAYKALEIHYPPLPEQKRIVKIIDEAFAGIATAKANAEKNLENARALFVSILGSTFRNKNPDWEEKPIGEVCEFIGGSQPPKSNFAYTMKPNHIRFIQIRDYKSDDHIVYIPKALARRFCEPDDIMIGRYGPPLFQILRGLKGAYNVALMKASPDTSVISNDYLYYFLRNPDILSYVIFHSSRTAGQTGVNKERLEPYPIRFPNKMSQSKIVERLSTLENELDNLASLQEKRTKELDALKKSILNEAFSGNL